MVSSGAGRLLEVRIYRTPRPFAHEFALQRPPYLSATLQFDVKEKSAQMVLSVKSSPTHLHTTAFSQFWSTHTYTSSLVGPWCVPPVLWNLCHISLGLMQTRSFDEMAARLSTGDASLLAELHAITSGLKVTITSAGIHDIETARRSMGGHGYSAFSGLGSIYADYVPSATYEGDNYVLDQQVVRAALKAFRSFTPSTEVKSLPPSSIYLRLLRGQPSLSSDWSVPETPILYLEWRAVKIVQELAHNANDTDASMNQRVSKAVTEAFIARQVGEMIKDLNSKSGLDGRSAVVVAKLYLLHLLTTVESALVDILSFGLLATSEQGRDPTLTLRKAVKALCEELLPEAIGLTDAFGFTDFELNSALGVSDGNAYQALWDAAQTEPLNQDEVTPAYQVRTELFYISYPLLMFSAEGVYPSYVTPRTKNRWEDVVQTLSKERLRPNTLNVFKNLGTYKQALVRGLLFVFLISPAWNDKKLDLKLSHAANETAIVDTSSIPRLHTDPDSRHWST
ncbi:oxidase [Salix suchowensis]|nr:oxidase [Salix suchowensis]